MPDLEELKCWLTLLLVAPTYVEIKMVVLLYVNALGLFVLASVLTGVLSLEWLGGGVVGITVVSVSWCWILGLQAEVMHMNDLMEIDAEVLGDAY